MNSDKIFLVYHKDPNQYDTQKEVCEFVAYLKQESIKIFPPEGICKITLEGSKCHSLNCNIITKMNFSR